MKSPNLEANNDAQKSLISPVINKNSRGMKFLNLVRSNKLNISPQLSKRISNKASVMKIMHNSKKDENDANGDEFLKFSPAINYDPNSSPSQGILSKRKIETPDSPANNTAKRKRVSFNDPVSTTKEYLITEEEERLKASSLIRCLTYDNEENEEDIEMEKIDEINENKENIVKREEEGEMEVDKVIKQEDEVKSDEEEEKMMEEHLILDHDYDGITQNTDITTSSIVEETTANSLVFKDKNEMMDYVMKNMSIDELLDRISSDESKHKEIIEKTIQTTDKNELMSTLFPPMDSKMTPEHNERFSIMINHISKLIKSNERFKFKILEILSEKHSKELLLVQALQANSTNTVCEKLTINNLVNYLIFKVNVSEDEEINMEMNRMNRAIMHKLLKSTQNNRGIASDQKEIQEMLMLLFTNMPKIDILDNVHEFLRNIIQHK